MDGSGRGAATPISPQNLFSLLFLSKWTQIFGAPKSTYDCQVWKCSESRTQVPLLRRIMKRNPESSTIGRRKESERAQKIEYEPSPGLHLINSPSTFQCSSAPAVKLKFQERGFVRGRCMSGGSLEARLPAKLCRADRCILAALARRTKFRPPDAGLMGRMGIGKMDCGKGDR
jgi:hypothetical protein